MTSRKLPSKLILIFDSRCDDGTESFFDRHVSPGLAPDRPRLRRDRVASVALAVELFYRLACGQLFYGPLLDRFGRKKPLFGGLIIYILASIGCVFSHSTDTLVAWRFLQAIGGCAAGVASMAMVRDLFTVQESGQVFSLLVLILGVSPLLAPTTGGYLSTMFGWRAVFILLALIATALFFFDWTLASRNA